MPAPHPVSCPAFFDIGIDSEESLGGSAGASKVQLAEEGVFFLEFSALKCKRHRPEDSVVFMTSDVWDIDYDDNMLIALKFDGSIVAWKGGVDAYVGIDAHEVETLSRKLFVLPEVAENIDTPHIICLRGDVGGWCAS